MVTAVRQPIPPDMHHVKAIWAALDLYQEQSQGLQSIQPLVGGGIIHLLESKHNITNKMCRMYSFPALSFKYFPNLKEEAVFETFIFLRI